MIEIKHKDTDEVLHRVEGDTLRGADLRGTNLIEADLGKADLHGAFLTGAELNGANLRGANLIDALLLQTNLVGADLTKADLNGADLNGADLNGADLNGADLNGAELIDADMTDVDLSGANLTGVRLWHTNFVWCNTLHQAKNLESVTHQGPSILDVGTLRACVADLPDVFLQGVGYTNDEIETLRAMYSQGIQYYSCFLSSTTANADFAERLRSDLISNNITCWHYRHDMKGGKFWRAQVNEAIKIHEKLVFIASEQSVQRPEVVREILEAIERERDTEQQKLFPIRLDDFILSEDALRFADRKMAAHTWPEDWIRYIRKYHVPDFTGWKDHDAYTEEFQRLLRDLKNPSGRPRIIASTST